MRIEPDIAPVASLFGEASRAAILTALLDGRALPAGEVARIAGIAPSAASGHLARLIAGKLVHVEREGRHRYYRLASPAVATVIEDLAQLTDRPLILTRPALSPAARALRHARSCYNHLAGELAVEIAQALETHGYLRRGEGKRYELDGESGRNWFAAQGIDFASLRPGRHGLARQCLDWTERRPHLAGPLGASLFRCWCERGWLTPSKTEPRLVEVTSLGRQKLRAQLGIKTRTATFDRKKNLAKPLPNE
jgi:DNA-binding transcriptional ArsR family regulator